MLLLVLVSGRLQRTVNYLHISYTIDGLVSLIGILTMGTPLQLC